MFLLLSPWAFGCMFSLCLWLTGFIFVMSGLTSNALSIGGTGRTLILERSLISFFILPRFSQLMLCIQFSICSSTELSVYIVSIGPRLAWWGPSFLTKIGFELNDLRSSIIFCICICHCSKTIIFYSRNHMYLQSDLDCSERIFVRKLRGSSTASCIREMSCLLFTSKIELKVFRQLMHSC